MSASSSLSFAGTKARCCCGKGYSGAAEELHWKALDIAQEQEAMLWELRAPVSLARLRCDQGRRSPRASRAVYGWFTEASIPPT